MLGWTPAEALQQEGYALVHPAHRELVKSTLERLGPMNRTAMCEYLMRSKAAAYVWVESQFSFIEDTEHSAPEVVVVVREITKRKEAEDQLVALNARLKDLSETDTLTGIANRRKFDETFTREFKRCYRSQSELSLLFIDIDKFKLFNDTYGHSAGDECIERVAKALESNLKRPGDLVARYGGEEFAVLLPETGAENAEMVAETLRLAVSDLAIPHEGNSHGRVTISIGVAGSKCDARSSEPAILAAADAALYVSKQDGRNRVSRAADSPSLRLVRPG
jgi:diguanylate cyclase (GGDEF)-like protein/PAS domain S-box-containing protein